jgi:hypothetical protein
LLVVVGSGLSSHFSASRSTLRLFR